MTTFCVFLLFTFASVMSQTVETNDNCPGFTINHVINGPDACSGQPHVNTRDIYQHGKPGKIGPQGDIGIKGQKGMKGNPGRSDDTAAELLLIKKKLSTMQSQLDVLMTPPSCAYINGSSRDSGKYLISPTQATYRTRISVYCNFTENNAETIIGHDTMEEVSVKKCASAKCYQRRINYDAPLREMVALIDRSAECRQYIKSLVAQRFSTTNRWLANSQPALPDRRVRGARTTMKELNPLAPSRNCRDWPPGMTSEHYRCTASVIFYGSNADYATWLSRNGTHMRYWGGATSQRNDYCACGETGTCVDSSKKCNCDRNSAPETSDEGYLTDKDKLPVIELRFGDTDASSEHGWHTLGPLICSGRSDQ